MQITFDEEMCGLINDLKWIDWHETYHCAIKQEANPHQQAVLVVTGSLLKRLQTEPAVKIDYWSIGDLFTDLLSSIAHGYPMDTASNRYVMAMLEAIRKYDKDKNNVTWTTWETS